jgi:agmatinase
MYPDVAALTDVHGKGKVGVVHFDAHFDGMPYYRHPELLVHAGGN